MAEQERTGPREPLHFLLVAGAFPQFALGATSDAAPARDTSARDLHWSLREPLACGAIHSRRAIIAGRN